jgi:hypothetical protein
MPVSINLSGTFIRSLISYLGISLIINCLVSCNSSSSRGNSYLTSRSSDSVIVKGSPDEYKVVYALLVLPENPKPGEQFRILAIGGKNIGKAQIKVSGRTDIESLKSKTGDESPYWRIDDFKGSVAGKYKITLLTDNKVVCDLEFKILSEEKSSATGTVWKSVSGWDSSKETIYSAWVNALFHGCDEQSTWPALHEVVRNQDKNFLYNYLSLGEDDQDGKIKLIMQPDCADNPFFLRAYFSWKLGLPFGYHQCDRGSLVRSPGTGQWVTNETASSNSNPVLALNNFLRRVMNEIHSGTARTALDDENSDYYPVSLDRHSLRPGIVYADPYGHTLILVGWVAQTKNNPGLLLAVDAQPDGTVGIKRFWKGNFLFNTSGVVGEPGFKAFRPISINNGKLRLMKNDELTSEAGFVACSLKQRKMKSDVFYHTMERLINPKPLDPEAALINLIQALHEQLLVRVISVANGEAWFKLNPGAVIPMPSGAAGIFQAGGQWENFSTPNRDLRLLIAMDAVLDFPDQVAGTPEDFNISGKRSPEEIREKLQAVMNQKISELFISYTHTDGTVQKLSLGEILERRDAFEMAYNPNDGIEIRWGAPENSDEKAKCHRHTPARQLETMSSVRIWFHKRLHPPT